MRILSRMVVTIAVIVAAAQSGIAQTEQAKAPAFSIVISTPRDVVKAGSEVRVQLTLTNVSDRKLFTRGEQLDVHDSQGNLVSETEYGLKMHGKDPNRPSFSGGTVFSIPIPPGETFKRNISLTKEFDLSKPGKYTIQAKRFDGITNTFVKSNAIKVTVIP